MRFAPSTNFFSVGVGMEYPVDVEFARMDLGRGHGRSVTRVFLDDQKSQCHKLVVTRSFATNRSLWVVT